MGVRFYDKENMLSNEEDYTTTSSSACNCNACSQQTTTTKTETSTTATQTTNSSYNANNLNAPRSGNFREIVGNYKEVRIEENVQTLRIVGNNNRIRITLNMGDLIVVGNNTRLKIETNHGHIKYTGNDGRICLGQGSTEQIVDYNGCNGVLKVVNSWKFKQHKSSQVNKIKDDVVSVGDKDYTNNIKTGKTCINKQFIGINTKTTPKKYPKQKSSSYGELNKVFNHKSSLPNMTTTTTATTPSQYPLKKNAVSNKTQQLPNSITQNFSNIIITNSTNVCITPYTN